MNICIFGGNFVRDPELKNVGAENVSVVNFTIAVNRKFDGKDGEQKNQPTYLDCEAWDSGAETISRNCKKGDYIIIYTSAKNESWKDKDTGNARSRVKFRVDRFEFVPGTRRKSVEEVSEPQTEQVGNDDNNGDIPF
jgi:single-strand DNA-binding protein